MTEQTEEKKNKFFTKKNILIGCGSIIGITILCIGFGSVLNFTPSGKATNTAEAIAQATEDAKPTGTNTPLPPHKHTCCYIKPEGISRP
ncbi:hypothetical protein KA005_42040 [bacterium]|nr:hypothetical protein [bacterium]